MYKFAIYKNFFEFRGY